MRTLLGSVLASFFLVSVSAPRPLAAEGAPPIPDDVRANVQARVDAGENPGIVVGMIGPAGETYFSAGVLKLGAPDKVEPDTLFEIGSITKVFTGTLLADMVRKGEVKLEDPVKKYLPETATLPKEDKREITLVDLAMQRSGLPRMPDNLAPADPEDPYVDYTADRLYAFLAKASLEHPIGSTYEYSNLGMGLLGHVLSRAAKTDYGTLVAKRITGPLKMSVTNLDVPAENRAKLAQGYSNETGTLKPAHAWTWNAASSCAGAGGLRSSARDMLRFVAANAGLVDTKLAAAMKDARTERADAGSPEMGIGLAWHILKKNGKSSVWHNGGTGGYRSFIAFDPATKTGVVVLTNSTESIDDIGAHLMDPASPLKPPTPKATVTEESLAKLDGYYDLGGPSIHVTHEGTQLYAQVSGQERYPVFPKSDKVFAFKVVPAELEFDVQPDGTVPKLTLHQGGHDIPAARMAAEAAPKERTEVAVDPKLLAEYAGRYAFAPGVVFDCVVQETHLACQLGNQPRLDVYPESPTSFFYKVVDAQISFDRNEAGKVASVTLHQGGHDQTAKRME